MVIRPKEVIFDAPENSLLCSPKNKVWGLTQKPEMLTPIEPYLFLNVLIKMEYSSWSYHMG